MTLPVRPIAISVLLLLAHVVTDAPASEPRSSGVGDRLTGKYTHRTWMREQGLPQNSVNAIIQARDGYLWIGTQEGLARFDGNQFTVYNRRNTASLRSNYIWSLIEDRNGAVWAGTSGGGVTRFSASSSTTFTTADGLPGNTVWCVFEDQDGRVWAGTDHGLAFLRPAGEDTEPSRFQSVAALENISVSAIAQAADGMLWLGTSDGFCSYGNDRLRRFSLAGLSGVYAISQARMNGEERIVAGAGEYLYVVERGAPRRLTRVPGPTPMLIFDMQSDTAGALWVATGGGGLRCFKGGSWSSFTAEDGLPDDQVRSLCIDREGTIWAGTYGGGLNALYDTKFIAYTRRFGLANEFVLSLSQGRDGSMWLGTYGGGLSRIVGNEVRNYPASSKAIPSVLTSVLEARDGTVYLGAPDLPLLGFDPRTGRIRPAASDSPVSIVSLFEDRAGRLWMGWPEGVSVLQRGKVQTYSSANSPIMTSVIAIAEAPDSSMWFGTQGDGLIRLHRGMFSRFTSSDGVTSEVVSALYAERGGTIWIGTDGGGLVRLSNGRFTSYSSAQGLFDDVIFTILEDEAGFLWMSSNNGIFRVRKSDITLFDLGTIRSIPCQSYGTADGMKSSECNGRRQPSGWKDDRGRLWFATLKGAVMVDPSSLRTQASPPPVVIERIQADEAWYPATHGLLVPAGTQRLAFEYTALSYIAPERTMFRYRLEGYDLDWIDAGPRRVAYYTNLSPGDYTFRVIARNNDGVWNETGDSVWFTLRPFFYQTTPFLTISGAALLLIAFTIGRLRVRQLQNREAELMTIVADRTQSLSAQKQQIESALRQAEEARRDAERQREIAEEANSLKSRLLRLAAHDMKSPLISMKGFIQIMRQQTDRNSAMGEMTDMMYGLTNNLVGLINQLLNSEAIESGRMTLVFAPVDANQLAREVVSFNSMFAASKHQTISFAGTDGGTCMVVADEARLRDAFDNLVTNAVKYSPPGKTIRVSVTREEAVVRFSVRDEGPGLNEEDQKKLFGRFQRLSAQPTGGESSTGLGLSITREIVDLHRGTITVQSEEGHGSTFTIELPAHP